MENTELINLWKSYDKKLSETLLLNRSNAIEIMKIKTKSALSSMKPIKIFVILIGLVWVGFGAVILAKLFVFSFDKISPFFLFSASIQVLLTAIALVIYLYQLILINQVDINEPILATQVKLTSLKTTTLWVTRILFLQLPVWTTFYWNESMLEHGNWILWIIQGIVTLSFAYAGIWLFFNIKFENKDKKWFRFIFNGKEWTPLMKSMQLLEQLDEYKTDSR